MSPSTESVRAALAQIQDPYTQTDISSAIRGVGVDGVGEGCLGLAAGVALRR